MKVVYPKVKTRKGWEPCEIEAKGKATVRVLLARRQGKRGNPIRRVVSVGAVRYGGSSDA